MTTDYVAKGEYRGLSITVVVLDWFLVIGGTLIWGYGDLGVCALNANVASKC